MSLGVGELGQLLCPFILMIILAIMTNAKGGRAWTAFFGGFCYPLPAIWYLLTDPHQGDHTPRGKCWTCGHWIEPLEPAIWTRYPSHRVDHVACRPLPVSEPAETETHPTGHT